MKKVLVIVAHPDDETIWMGGTLLTNRDNWKTTIVSLCRKNDKDRALKFAEACKIYNAECFISDLDDSEQGEFKEITSEEIIQKIKKFTDGKSYNYLFTHGRNGEYGHKRHTEVNNAVREMLKRGQLCCKKIFFFSYVEKGGLCYNNQNADKFIYLNNLKFKEKKDLILKTYGFKDESYETRCCRNTESFKVKTIT